MNQELEDIEDYFSGNLSLVERQRFELRIKQDVLFAEEVAFYAATRQIAQQQSRQMRFEKLRQDLSHTQPVRRVLSPVWTPISIAATLLLGIGIWFFMRDPSVNPTQLADDYFQQNFTQLPSRMDASTDSLQLGIQLYNQKKYPQALAIFSVLSSNQTEALQYAGITAIHLYQYDQAISFFERLSGRPGLVVNNGLFYAALVYLKKGDTQTGKRLLNEVISQQLAGESEAKEILKKIED